MTLADCRLLQGGSINEIARYGGFLLGPKVITGTRVKVAMRQLSKRYSGIEKDSPEPALL